MSERGQSRRSDCALCPDQQTFLRVRRHVSRVPSGDIARLARSSAGPPGRRAAARAFAGARGFRRALAYYNNSSSKSNSV